MQNKKVRVNNNQCKAIGKVLQNLSVKSSVYEREFFTFPAKPESKLRAYLFSIAICQQTHNLINKRLNLVGFNYLEKVYTDLAKADSELIDPAFVARQSTHELSSKLAQLFSDTGDIEHSTLDRLAERSDLLIDMSSKLVNGYSGQISTLLARSNGYLGGERGIYQLLSDFQAYSDPFRKKSSLLVTFAQKAGLLTIKDIDHLVPIMDYHMQRVLLRFGCVEILDARLKQALIDQEKMESDAEIRFASIEAVRQLARYSGHPLLAIHDFLWPLGRSCCKEKPLCKHGACDKNPCTFNAFVHLSSHKNCAFDGVCKGSMSEEYIKLWQPIIETHYY